MADLQEGAAKNVALTYHINEGHEDWAKKYSFATPAKVYDALQRTITAGCPSPLRIAQDIKRIFEETLGRIVEAQGCYIEDSSGRIARSGVRAEAAAEYKRKTIPVDASALTSFHKMVDKMTSGGGVSFVFDDKNDVAEVCHDTLTTIAVSDDDDDFDGNEDNNEINEVEEWIFHELYVTMLNMRILFFCHFPIKYLIIQVYSYVLHIEFGH